MANQKISGPVGCPIDSLLSATKSEQFRQLHVQAACSGSPAFPFFFQFAHEWELDEGVLVSTPPLMHKMNLNQNWNTTQNLQLSSVWHATLPDPIDRYVWNRNITQNEHWPPSSDFPFLHIPHLPRLYKVENIKLYLLDVNFVCRLLRKRVPSRRPCGGCTRPTRILGPCSTYWYVWSLFLICLQAVHAALNARMQGFKAVSFGKEWSQTTPLDTWISK